MPRARKKAAPQVDEDLEDLEEEAPKKKRGRPARSAKAAQEESPAPRKRGRPARSAKAPQEEESPAPRKRGRRKAATVEEESPAPRKRGRPARKAATVEEEAPAPKRKAKGNGESRPRPTYAEKGIIWDTLDSPLSTRVFYDEEICKPLRAGGARQGHLYEFMTSGVRKRKGALVKQVIAHIEEVEDEKFAGKGESMVKWWIDNEYLSVAE